MPALCKNCQTSYDLAPARCTNCGRPGLISHDELFDLSIAHMDCDAFYASVEKRDNPQLRDKPVIIGGGRRGVVSTACYVARIRGVRSAMPMFQALKKCPDAVIVKPRMDAYVEASKAIRKMMEDLTPDIEPLSLDEAFLDLTGTHRLHGAPPAVMLAKLVHRMKSELGLTGSIGLSHNKFLAKVASDLDKPDGYSIIGLAETETFLRDKPISLIWGVGAVTREALNKVGIRTFADLLRWDRKELSARFGSMGDRLWHLARGQDRRRVSSHAPVKSISKETTFGQDTIDLDVLDGHVWRLAEQVSDRAKAKNKAGRVVTLKLKRDDFSLISRRVALREPTQSADTIYTTAKQLFAQVQHTTPYRLIGVGLSDVVADNASDLTSDMLDHAAIQRQRAERATDKIREKFGKDAIIKGRSLR